MLNLVEGNVGGGLQGDFYWGSAGYDTIFRNVFCGVDTAWTGAGNEENNMCLKIDASNQWYNVVGNILGSPAIASITCGKPNTWAYMMTGQPGINNSQPVIYRLGYPGIDSDGYTGTNINNQSLDTNVLGTMIMVQNFDYSHNAIQNSTNVPLPASYYLPGKPSWFGNCPWPPFDPTNAAGASVTNIPAGYRLVMGSAPPAGAQPPVAVANASPVSGTIPLSVAFSSAGSSDPGGATLTYNWVFGDGSTSTVANPSHTYQSAGVYSAQLTVSDGTNQTPSSVMTISATNAVTVSQPPVAVANASPTSGNGPLSVVFSSVGSSDPGGATLTYSWAFGDGSTSTAANPSHTYQSAGVYSSQLTVSDGTSQASSSVMTITVAGTTNGLVAAYGFEEGSGSVVSDTSGNGNTGTVTGATWSTAGRYGNALVFNGTNSLVTVNDSAVLDLSAGMTLEAWINPTILNSQQWMSVIYKPVTTSATVDYVLQGSSRSSEVPSAGVSVSTSNVSGPTILPLNTWSHLAGTYDGTTMRLYVNGVQVASQAQTGTIAASTQPLTIGANWAGLIDEVRIYNRALGATEVQADMNKAVVTTIPTPPSPTGLRFISN
jgi:PKD repeat protein